MGGEEEGVKGAPSRRRRPESMYQRLELSSSKSTRPQFANPPEAYLELRVLARI